MSTHLLYIAIGNSIKGSGGPARRWFIISHKYLENIIHTQIFSEPGPNARGGRCTRRDAVRPAISVGRRQRCSRVCALSDKCACVVARTGAFPGDFWAWRGSCRVLGAVLSLGCVVVHRSSARRLAREPPGAINPHRDSRIPPRKILRKSVYIW